MSLHATIRPISTRTTTSDRPHAPVWSAPVRNRLCALAPHQGPPLLRQMHSPGSGTSDRDLGGQPGVCEQQQAFDLASPGVEHLGDVQFRNGLEVVDGREQLEQRRRLVRPRQGRASVSARQPLLFPSESASGPAPTPEALRTPGRPEENGPNRSSASTVANGSEFANAACSRSSRMTRCSWGQRGLGVNRMRPSRLTATKNGRPAQSLIGEQVVAGVERPSSARSHSWGWRSWRDAVAFAGGSPRRTSMVCPSREGR